MMALDCDEKVDCRGSGTCNQNGTCDCFEGYSGENCEIYNGTSFFFLLIIYCLLLMKSITGAIKSNKGLKSGAIAGIVIGSVVGVSFDYCY